MTKIEQIKDAIERANNLQSKLSAEAIGVPFLGSLKIRALLNNLGALATHVMDIGCHKGGSLCSMIFGNDNIQSATAIDSWASDETNEDKAYPQFVQNTRRFSPKRMILHEFTCDCWQTPLREIENKIDLYSYDAGHSKDDQMQALVHYKDVLADEFIYVCDDWHYKDVKEGTIEGLRWGNYEVLFEQELLNPEGSTEEDHLNDHWWRGYYVALLKKK